MKALLLVCALFLFMAILNLPIGHYTFLSIVVTIGALAVVATELKDGINFWLLIFGLTAILFNPLIPVYLNDKSLWMPIDLLCGLMFVVRAITFNKEENDGAKHS